MRRLMARGKTKVNLEMAVTAAMVRFAEKLRPHNACFVPEKRQELTTEGGLDVVAHRRKIKDAVVRLQERGILVALFIDPDQDQIECARENGAHGIEIHTGSYCNANGAKRQRELRKIIAGAQLAKRLGLEVHGGHGLDYDNVLPIAAIPEMVELNIGHSIVQRQDYRNRRQQAGVAPATDRQERPFGRRDSDRHEKRRGRSIRRAITLMNVMRLAHCRRRYSLRHGQRHRTAVGRGDQAEMTVALCYPNSAKRFIRV